ncbi:hypothetical protein D3C83_254210 [compost metagenome]
MHALRASRERVPGQLFDPFADATGGRRRHHTFEGHRKIAASRKAIARFLGERSKHDRVERGR